MIDNVLVATVAVTYSGTSANQFGTTNAPILDLGH